MRRPHPASALRLQLFPVLPAALALLAGAGPAGAESANVTYVTGSAVYLDAGADRGLVRGTPVTLLRDGQRVATLVVTAAASKRASCSLPDPPPDIRIGDEARWAFDAASLREEIAPVDEGLPDAARAPESLSVRDWLRERGLRGRVGVHYAGYADGTEFGRDWRQPAFDFRLDGKDLGGRPLRVAVDLRARRTWRTAADGSEDAEGRTRVYRLATGWGDDRARWRLDAGRQLSTAITSISVFDGVSAEAGGDSWRFGAFSGMQPDPITWGWSTDIVEHGVWITRRSLRGTGAEAMRWRVTGGLVGSYTGGTIDREYAIVQGRWLGPHGSVLALQEVDLNRGWKSDVESTVSLTSTYASGRWIATRVLELQGGFDGRRRVRRWRDRITPETEFDDDFRRGVWTGASVRLARTARIGTTWRRTSGGSTGAADVYTTTAYASWPRLSDASIRGRATRYTNDRTEGWLTSASLGAAIGRLAHAEVTAGRRDEAGDGLSTGSDQTWIGLDADFRIARGWYSIVSWERTRGALEEGTQVRASTAYRF